MHIKCKNRIFFAIFASVLQELEEDMKSDIEIARSVKMRKITDVASEIGIPQEQIEQYGHYMAKVDEHLIDDKKVKETIDFLLNREEAHNQMFRDAFNQVQNSGSNQDFGTTKADPGIYRRAAQQLHTPVEQVLFLDDNIHADTVAKSAGMQVCGVFDPSSADYVDDMKSISDYYIYNFSELLAL